LPTALQSTQGKRIKVHVKPILFASRLLQSRKRAGTAAASRISSVSHDDVEAPAEQQGHDTLALTLVVSEGICHCAVAQRTKVAGICEARSIDWDLVDNEHYVLLG
jgi:hypothetical protein